MTHMVQQREENGGRDCVRRCHGNVKSDIWCRGILGGIDIQVPFEHREEVRGDTGVEKTITCTEMTATINPPTQPEQSPNRARSHLVPKDVISRTGMCSPSCL